MAEDKGDFGPGKAIGPVVGGLISGLLIWLTAGWPGWLQTGLAGLLSLGVAVTFAVFGLMVQRYAGILGCGGEPEGSDERKAYDALRDRLSGDNLVGRTYTQLLTAFLGKIDRFFGDVGQAEHTWLSRAVGLTAPAPLWTTPAFDRCLLLALAYPIACIFLLWGVSGHVGPAEATLGLPPDLVGGKRVLAVVMLAGAGLSFIMLMRSDGWPVLAWAAVAFAFAFAVAFAVAIAVAFAVAVAVAVAGTVVGAVAIAVAVAFAFAVAFAVAGAGAFAFAFTFAVAGAVAIAVAVAVAALQDVAIRRRWQGRFLSLFLVAMIIICLVAAWLLSPLASWGEAGPLLLFLGLLTLLNAPFDWFSLGLTRALLRRGLERGKWWPLLYGLFDLASAVVIIVALALAMVLGVQAFDDLAVLGGGGEIKRILPLGQLLDGIAAEPWQPEYWWVYALLLSTMVPSLLNLMIGGASLARGIPAPWMLAAMPVGKPVPAFNRPGIAIVLAGLDVGGAIAGLIVQFALAVGVFVWLLPAVGLNLLELARATADLDLPMQMFHLLGLAG